MTSTESSEATTGDQGPLLPCPFCGNEPTIHVGESNFDDAYVSCEACGAGGPIFDNDPESGGHSTNPRADATDHWNNRFVPSKDSNDHQS